MVPYHSQVNIIMMNFTHIRSTYAGAVPLTPHVFTLVISDREIAFIIGTIMTYGLLRPRFVDAIGRMLCESLRLGFSLYCMYYVCVLFVATKSITLV